MLASPAGTRVHTESLEMGVQELCHASACGFGDLLVQIVALAWLVALALLAVAALSYVREATGVVEGEMERTRSEAEALRRFRRRVTAFDAHAPGTGSGSGVGYGPGPAGGAVGIAVTGTGPPDGRLGDVRAAYEETVMAVPHYEEEYDESLRTHLAAEFGEEIAHAVVDGDSFTPQLRRVISSVADEGISRREDLLRAMGRERDALVDYGEALARVDEAGADAVDRPLYRRSFGELFDAWYELDDLEAEADRLLADRQEAVAHGGTVGAIGHDRESFHAYLYGGLDVDYPVLAAGAETVSRLRSIRRDVLESLTRRV